MVVLPARPDHKIGQRPLAPERAAARNRRADDPAALNSPSSWKGRVSTAIQPDALYRSRSKTTRVPLGAGTLRRDSGITGRRRQPSELSGRLLPCVRISRRCRQALRANRPARGHGLPRRTRDGTGRLRPPTGDRRPRNAMWLSGAASVPVGGGWGATRRLWASCALAARATGVPRYWQPGLRQAG